MKGGKKKLLILIPILAVVAAAVTAVVVNAAFIRNSIKKATMKPEEYCQYVLKENMKDSQSIVDVYDAYIYQKIQGRTDMGYTGEIALQLSDDAQDLLQDKLGTGSLEAFSDLRVGYEQRRKDNLYELGLKLSSGKDSIISGDAIYDAKEQIAYGISPELNEDYIKIVLADIADESDLERFDLLFAAVDHMADAYPDAKALRELQERYNNILIEALDNVKESDKKLTVEGITQSFTVLTIKIDEDQLKEMTVAICEAAMDDDTLKDLVVGMTDVFAQDEFFTMVQNSHSMPGDPADEGLDGEKVWESLKDELQDMVDNIDDMDLSGTELEVQLYVSGTGKIQGVDRILENADDESMRSYYAYVTKGSNIAAEGTYLSDDGYDEMNLAFTGKGTLALGKLNAEVNADYDGKDVEFRLENVDVAGLKKGHIAGDLACDLGQFKSQLNDMGLKELKDQTLVISLDVSAESSRFEIRLEEGKELFASFSVSGQYDKAGSIKVPADSECVEVADKEAMQDYADDCDIDGLKDRLDDLGFMKVLERPSSPSGNIGGTMGYIESSKVSADTQLADSVHTAVLTALFTPEIVNNPSFNVDYKDLTAPVDITQYTGEENVILGEAALILGVDDLHELSDRIKSAGATGRILVTITGPNNVKVVLEGTNDGNGQEICVEN